ncbi:hypothetical protein PR048_015904, partial [Dryococelus australis]
MVTPVTACLVGQALIVMKKVTCVCPNLATIMAAAFKVQGRVRFIVNAHRALQPLYMLSAGPTCQLSNDICLSNPCQNGGTCINQVNGYMCNCTEYFMGDNCQLEYDACSSSPCEHNGTCLSQTNKREYICECT